MDAHALTPDMARDYLMQDRDRHLLQLGALAYDAAKPLAMAQRAGSLCAVALLVERSGVLPDTRPYVMVAADDPPALDLLLGQADLTADRIWATTDPALRDRIAERLGRPAHPERGQLFYGDREADHITLRPIDPPALRAEAAEVRQLSEGDAARLDLSPCMLSSTALRGWLRSGWRVFGAIERQRLLAHALAAYPIGGAEEVAAVYTAGRARRHGIAATVVGRAIADIRSHGREAYYVASRSNIPSRRLAERIGLRQIAESWEILAA
jgi:GNAT superfamily N-acetyltransferase